MANCEVKTRSGNDVVLSIAEEECMLQLPEIPTWFELEPNSFGDFGGEVTKVTRAPINASRQKRKGRKVNQTASASFNHDFTKTSLNRLLQGFLFADARELPTTKPLALVVNPVVISAATAANGYSLTGGEHGFKVGYLVIASGFAFNANNGVKAITASSNVAVNATPACVAEPSIPAKAALETCGYQFAEGDVSVALASSVVSLVSATTDFREIEGLAPGTWVYIGGDTATNRFANNQGFARVKSVAENAVILDELTFAPSTEAGTGKSIRLFFGPIIRNEKDRDLIKMRSYQLERTLGDGPVSEQAEYVEGAVASEFALSFPTEDKLAADLTFTACRRTFATGGVGDEMKTGNRVSALGEEAYNTSSDVYRMRLSLVNPDSSVRSGLVGYVSEGSLSISNNASAVSAIGSLGAIDFQFGDFDVTGSLTAYFTDVSAVKAIDDDVDCSFNIIGAYSNAGFVFDMPLLTVSASSLNVEKDNSITLPIEKTAVEGAEGFTLLYQYFPYLPNAAMPE